MQYSQERLKTMVYAKFGEQTECIMGNWKIENGLSSAGTKGYVCRFWLVDFDPYCLFRFVVVMIDN